MVKKILSILLWTVTAAGIIVAAVFARNQYLHSPLSSIVLSIQRPHANGFVDYNDGYERILALCDTSVNNEISKIDIDTIAGVFNANPWVAKASASITLDGVLKVLVKEYEPVMRVYNRQQQSVYITAEGMVLPSSRLFAPNVIIANGDIGFVAATDKTPIADSLYSESQLADVYRLVRMIQSDGLLNSAVEQVYFDKNGDVELIQRNCRASLLLGSLDNLDDKLNRAHIFLTQKSGTSEMTEYKQINLKYNNQVVCVK